MSLPSIAATVWTYPTRTLATGTPAPPTTRAGRIAATVWSYADRTITETRVTVAPAVLHISASYPTSKRFLTPDTRTLRVPRESRARLVRDVARVAPVPRESRRRIVPAERRVLGVPRESRTLKG